MSSNQLRAVGVAAASLTVVAVVAWIAFGPAAHAAPAPAGSPPVAFGQPTASPASTPIPPSVAPPSVAPTTSPSLPPPGRNLLCTEADDLATEIAGPTSDAWARLQALRAAPSAGPLLLALVFGSGGDDLVAVDGVTGSTTALVHGIRLNGTIPFGGSGSTLTWAPRGSSVLIGVSGGCGHTAVYDWSAAGMSRLDRLVTGKPGIDAAWSPDGDAVAISAEGSTGIWPTQRSVQIVETDGTPTLSLLPLPCDRCAVAGRVSWSPDGRWLAVPYHEFGPTGEHARGVAFGCLAQACAPGPRTRLWKLVPLADPQPLGWRSGHELIATGTVGRHRRRGAVDPHALPRREVRVIEARASDIAGPVPGLRRLVIQGERLGGRGDQTVLALRDVRTGLDRPLWTVPDAVGLGFRFHGASRDGSLVAISTGNGRFGTPEVLWLVSTTGHRRVRAEVGVVLAATWVPPLR